MEVSIICSDQYCNEMTFIIPIKATCCIIWGYCFRKHKILITPQNLACRISMEMCNVTEFKSRILVLVFMTYKAELRNHRRQGKHRH